MLSEKGGGFVKPIRAFIPKRGLLAALEEARKPKQSTPQYLAFKAWLRSQKSEVAK